MITISDTIPKHKILTFDSILKATDGRYHHKPLEFRNSYHITVTFQDSDKYGEFSKAWNRACLEIKETRASFFKRLQRAIKGRFIALTQLS
jgi:hypothetical protein